MQSTLEDALDKLVSLRSSLKVQADALTSIEWVLADTLSELDKEQKSEIFLSLQDSFQCNIASRMLTWLAHHAYALKMIGEEKVNGVSQAGEEELTVVIVQALSLLQGVSFLHKPSKDYLGRKCSIEVLLDLLSTYRHVNTKPFANSTNTSSPRHSITEHHISQSLAVAVLDTLLCILVDSSSSMRAFESARGVEQLVKILKRTAIPKDVRMKCLEFIYFYLMNESPSDRPTLASLIPPSPTKFSRHLSSLQDQEPSDLTFSVSLISSDSLRAPDRSASSMSLSPTPTLSGTPPQTPTKSSVNPYSRRQQDQNEPVLAPLAMLRKDVDFVPLSPKKAQIAGLGLGGRRPGSGGPAPPIASRRGQRVPSPLIRTVSEDTLLDSERSVDDGEPSKVDGDGGNLVRTTEEKKELLGHLLGNVDALVDGIRTAGIWGLRE